jgi:hypothetical protein
MRSIGPLQVQASQRADIASPSEAARCLKDVFKDLESKFIYTLRKTLAGNVLKQFSAIQVLYWRFFVLGGMD